MGGKWRWGFLFAVLVLAAVAACSRNKQEENVYYQVGTGEITRDDVERVFSSLPEDLQYPYLSREGRQQLLGNMVSLELLYQEAVKQKLDQEPEVKFRLDREKKNLLAQEVVERSLKIEDLYAYYQQNFIRIDGIEFPVRNPENAAEKNAARGTADQVFQALKAGANFGQLKARYHSDRKEALGYMSRDRIIVQFGPDAASEIFGRKKDDKQKFTKPLYTGNAWQIFYVLEYPQNLEPRGYDLVWQEILNSKREEIFRGLINDLRAQIPVKANQKAIDELLAIGDEWDKRQANPPQAGSTAAPSPGPAAAQLKPEAGGTGAGKAPAQPAIQPAETVKPKPPAPQK